MGNLRARKTQKRQSLGDDVELSMNGGKNASQARWVPLSRVQYISGSLALEEQHISRALRSFPTACQSYPMQSRGLLGFFVSKSGTVCDSG